MQSLYFVYHHGFLQVCHPGSKPTSKPTINKSSKGFVNLGFEVLLSLKAERNIKSQ